MLTPMLPFMSVWDIRVVARWVCSVGSIYSLVDLTFSSRVNVASQAVVSVLVVLGMSVWLVLVSLSRGPRVPLRCMRTSASVTPVLSPAAGVMHLCPRCVRVMRGGLVVTALVRA